MSKKLNYNNLMAYKPTVLTSMKNSKDQEIELVENPIRGDLGEVICVCHKLQLAQHSGFFDTEDLTADHLEYEPSFQDGKLFIGDFQHD
ncbi:MAG: hypothetical protein ABJH04_08215 [Cyclobacteriaceae bacterium]